MAFDVPYVINGSKHSARLFRRQYQNSTGEGSGVTRAGDLRVSPLNVPGDGFRVAPGGATVQSRDTFASSRESYGPVNDQEIVVTGVPGTGSGESRRDLVILEIMDPGMESVTYPEPSTEEGWQDGDNFCRVTIIQDVDSLVPSSQRPVRSLDQITTGAYANVSGVALAAINYEPSTATITEAMIEDLRVVQQPRRSEVVFARPRVSADDGAQAYLNGTMANGGEYFPGGGGFSNQFEVDVPDWATRMIIDASWMSVEYAASRDPRGRYWIEYGDEYRDKTWPSNRNYEFGTQEFVFNAPLSADVRTANWLLMDNRSVPAKLRGKRATFVFKAGLSNSPGANSVWMRGLGGLGCRITFVETALGWEDAI